MEVYVIFESYDEVPKILGIHSSLEKATQWINIELSIHNKNVHPKLHMDTDYYTIIVHTVL